MYEELNNSLNPSNVPPFRADLAYPELTGEMIGRIQAYGSIENLPDETVLFKRDEHQVVASTVGEGSVMVTDLHRYLADHRAQVTAAPMSALAAMQSAKIGSDNEVPRDDQD